MLRLQTVSLRDRLEDVPDLARFFLNQIAGPKFALSDSAARQLLTQTWPGNIRELRNSIERAIIGARRRKSSILDTQDFGDLLQLAVISKSSESSHTLPRERVEISRKQYESYLLDTERDYLKCVLDLCDWNQSEAADRLGISRSTLLRRISELDLVRRGPSKDMPAPGLARATRPSARRKESPHEA